MGGFAVKVVAFVKRSYDVIPCGILIRCHINNAVPCRIVDDDRRIFYALLQIQNIFLRQRMCASAALRRPNRLCDNARRNVHRRIVYAFYTALTKIERITAFNRSVIAEIASHLIFPRHIPRVSDAVAHPAVREHRVLVAGVRLAPSAFFRRQAAPRGSVPRLDLARRVAVEVSRQSAVPRVSINAVAQAEIIPHAVAVFFFQLVAPFVEAHPFRRIRLDLLPCVHVDFPARHRRRHGVQFFHAAHKLGVVCLHLLILLAQPRAFASGFGVPAVISLLEFSVPVFQICPGCEALSYLNGVLYLVNEGIQQRLRPVFQVAAQFNAVEPAVIPAVLPALKILERYADVGKIGIGCE